MALSSGRSFTVNASARLNFGTKIISGAGSTFSLATNGTIDIGHQDGIVAIAGGNNGNIKRQLVHLMQGHIFIREQVNK